MNSVQPINANSASCWWLSVSFMPAHATKGTSNINAHDFFLHTANLIRGELLKVFSNNAVRATDREPVYGDGDELRTDCGLAVGSLRSIINNS